MNFTNFDLNLLMVFNAVMQERNITRAGNALGMSQPAVSNALNRIRYILEDDLFIRGANGMQPTSRALELAGPIREALINIEEALNPVVFDPLKSTRTFTIATSDYIYMTIMPYISSYLSSSAPQVSMSTLPIDTRVFEKLDSNETDFAITLSSDVPSRFDSEAILDDEFVVMMRADHPLARYDEIPLEEYSAARHMLISPRGGIRGVIDDLLEKEGKKRHVALTVNSFGSVPMILLSSNLVVTMPSQIAKGCGQFFNLKTVPSPLVPSRGTVELSLVWHKRLTKHPAHSWFRQLIIRAAQDFKQYGIDHLIEHSHCDHMVGTE